MLGRSEEVEVGESDTLAISVVVELVAGAELSVRPSWITQDPGTLPRTRSPMKDAKRPVVISIPPASHNGHCTAVQVRNVPNVAQYGKGHSVTRECREIHRTRTFPVTRPTTSFPSYEMKVRLKQ